MAGEDKFEPHKTGPAPVLEELSARLERIEARLDEMEDAASGGDSQEPMFENNDLVVLATKEKEIIICEDGEEATYTFLIRP